MIDSKFNTWITGQAIQASISISISNFSIALNIISTSLKSYAPANAEVYWFLVLDDFKTLFRDIPLIKLSPAMIRYMCDAR